MEKAFFSTNGAETIRHPNANHNNNIVRHLPHTVYKKLTPNV